MASSPPRCKKFQSTPPCGGDPVHMEGRYRVPDFNPRPLAGATKIGGMVRKSWHISIHAPLRGRRSTHYSPVIIKDISIHAPLRGRLPRRRLCPRASRFQSTPPCGGDMVTLNVSTVNVISIHAPLRGRQDSSEIYNRFPVISIHAPLRGRQCSVYFPPWTRHFNPRPLAGATYGTILAGGSCLISIHAPLRGRLDKVDKTIQDAVFQSTPPCGGDWIKRPL